MDVYPHAWTFFIPSISVITFTVLNLFIGIVVDAIATVKQQNDTTRHDQLSSKQDIDLIRKDLSALKIE
ncbi:MAG: hypothetical protein ABF297_10870 [Thiogranum sp.]